MREHPVLHFVFLGLALIPRHSHRGCGFTCRGMQGLPVAVALGVPWPVLEHVLHRAGIRLFELVEHRLIRLVRDATHGTLKVVELDDDHLGAVGRNAKIDAGLLEPRGRRSLRWTSSASRKVGAVASCLPSEKTPSPTRCRQQSPAPRRRPWVSSMQKRGRRTCGPGPEGLESTDLHRTSGRFRRRTRRCPYRECRTSSWCKTRGPRYRTAAMPAIESERYSCRPAAPLPTRPNAAIAATSANQNRPPIATGHAPERSVPAQIHL